jgi:hypothetical protein
VKFAGVSGLALVYIAAVYSAAVLVSSLTWRSATSVMILVTVWMVFVLAIPNLAPFLAQAWLPTRNPAELRSEKRNALEEIRKREVEEKMKAYDDKIGLDSDKPWWKQIDWRDPEGRKKALRRWNYRLECGLKANLEGMRAVDRIGRGFANRLDSQVALGRWLSRLSPFSCFAMAAAELTDAGEFGRRRFLEQVREHQAVLARYAAAEWKALNEHEIEHGKRPPPWSDPANRKKPIPVFSYVPPAAGDYVRLVALDSALLAGAAVLFFMLSYVAFLRYDVR